jgi:hypothetical protein
MISNGDICCSINYCKDIVVGVLKLFFNSGLNSLSNENIENYATYSDGEDKRCCKEENELRSYSEIIKKVKELEHITYVFGIKAK